MRQGKACLYCLNLWVCAYQDKLHIDTGNFCKNLHFCYLQLSHILKGATREHLRYQTAEKHDWENQQLAVNSVTWFDSPERLPEDPAQAWLHLTGMFYLQPNTRCHLEVPMGWPYLLAPVRPRMSHLLSTNQQNHLATEQKLLQVPSGQATETFK